MDFIRILLFNKLKMDETTRQFLKDFIDNGCYDELYENIKKMIKTETEKTVKDQAERRRQKEI